jgi:uncharacterized membrane protein YeaQ/YmgE (transglycosylase-associated protein family)
VQGVIGTIVGGLVLGVIVGSLARLVLPGKQDISLVITIVIGFIGAILGGVLAEVVGVRETEGIDWIKLVFQVGFAAIGVTAYGKMRATRAA